jgi:signal transduction histidine kinase
VRLDLARSLRLKLISIILLTTLAALVVALVAIGAYDLRAYQRNLADDVSTQAELLGRMSASAISFDDPKVAKANLDLLRLRPQVQAAAIYTAKGALFATYDRPGSRLAFPKLPEADGMRVDGRQLMLYRRIVNDREILGTVYLRTDYELVERIRDYVGIAIAVTLVAMLVALALSAQLHRVVTNPILAIADVAHAVVQQHDYSRRAKKMSGDEVGVLVDAFNRMLAEIERRTAELEVSNVELGRQVAERFHAEQEIVQLNAVLEDRVRERTAQLESANHELEAFSFSVSHDLRAPLRHINGYARMLSEDAGDRLDDSMRRYLDSIGASARQMGVLIDDLLAFSRLGRKQLELLTVDMTLVAEHALGEICGDRASSAKVHIAGPLPPANADPVLMKQVWVNLLSNALKYSAKRGDTARVEVSGERDGAINRYRVHDNGVGFDMRYVDKLFGVFQRLHPHEEFEGTGVGLAIVQRIVARHGGKVRAEGEPDRGATFTFELPAAMAQRKENTT